MGKPRLTRETWKVQLTAGDDVVEHEIDVAPADQLRAETEAQKHGIKDLRVQRLNYASLYVYNACVRLGLYAHPYASFLVDLYDWDQVKGEDGEPAETPVDPTQADTSASDSSSPLPSPDSSTQPVADGATPTSTSD